MRAYIDPSPSEVEALTLEAVKLAVELGIDTKAEDQEGRTAADQPATSQLWNTSSQTEVDVRT